MAIPYVCTDSDCAQHQGKLSDMEYSMIEYREYPGSYVVCQGFIDLTDFDFDEMEAMVAPYYGSLDTIAHEYGFWGAFPIIAECVFEQMGFSEMEFNREVKTEQEARDYIKQWIKSQSRR